MVQREPLLLAMSPSGVDKGELTPGQILLVDEHAHVHAGSADVSSAHEHAVRTGHSVSADALAEETFAFSVGKPSDETLLHVEIVKRRHAGAVLHTHSVWNTILSDLFADKGGVAIEGYEMLKGLTGVQTHEHREWLRIIGNSQDMRELAANISGVLAEEPKAHGLLLHKHGLYSWGKDLAEAKKHIEILEFLLEAVGRTLELRSRGN